MLVDTNAVLQVFGCLMKNPLLLSETDKYSLSPDDFTSLFEKYIFTSIYNLSRNGADKISPIDIDNYLVGHPGHYEIFKKSNGIAYIQDAEDLSQIENFPYYYRQIKKFSALRAIQKLGYQINNIYMEDITDKRAKDINERFESLELQDIFDSIKKDIHKLENDFIVGSNSDRAFANNGIRDLVNSLKDRPEVGSRIQGEIFNTVVRGARKGKFYIRSGGTGVGKTRSLVGDACYIAYPIRYSSSRQKWVNNGDNERVLFIVTEQEISEIQTLILSYLTDINEEIILYGHYSPEEFDRIQQAYEIIDFYKENFIIAQMPDPSIGQIKAVVRQQYLTNQIQNVFYDYIFSSPSLLAEYRDLRIRTDEILMMLSNTLKELAGELDIFVMSSTQLNGEVVNAKGIRDQNLLRGAKSIADKADVGCITMGVSKEEKNLLDTLIKEYGVMPNQVTDVYKVRRGRYKDVRIWSKVDLGTCRKDDLFITDDDFKVIENFQPKLLMFDSENIGEINQLLLKLNNGELVQESGSEIERRIKTIIQNTPIPLEYTPKENKDYSEMGWDDF